MNAGWLACGRTTHEEGGRYSCLQNSLREVLVIALGFAGHSMLEMAQTIYYRVVYI